jgi:hypothetical protein
VQRPVTTSVAPIRIERRVCDVLERVRRRERQRQHLVARPLGDRERRLLRETLAVGGQPVHRQEVDARPDVLLGEREPVLVAGRAGTLRVDAHDVQVMGVRVAQVARDGLDPLQLGNRRVVEFDLRQPQLAVPLDLVELAERDRREHVGKVRLVAGYRDVVERAVSAAHDRQVSDAPGQVVVVRRDDPALACRNRLRRIQREAGRPREAADLAAAVLALGRMRGVLDDRQAERPQRVEIDGLAVQVDGQDCLCPRRDELDHALGVDVQVGVADVSEDGGRARVDDHVRRRRPRDRRRDHLVSGADPERDEREMHRRGPGRDGKGVRRADVVGEAALELLRPRAGGQPARADRVGNGRDLLVADGGRLEPEEASSLGRQVRRHRQ